MVNGDDEFALSCVGELVDDLHDVLYEALCSELALLWRGKGGLCANSSSQGRAAGAKVCLNLKNPSSARRSIRSREKREKREAGLHTTAIGQVVSAAYSYSFSTGLYRYPG